MFPQPCFLAQEESFRLPALLRLKTKALKVQEFNEPVMAVFMRQVVIEKHLQRFHNGFALTVFFFLLAPVTKVLSTTTPMESCVIISVTDCSDISSPPFVLEGSLLGITRL